MPVPNTTTFTLQDVVDEVNPTTDDLVDCFADSIAGYFDPLYSGSTNNLLNFRNYGPKITLTTSSILFNNGDNPTKVYEHNHTGNTSTLLTIPSIVLSSADIAHTSNKLWLISSGIREWDITLNPFTATYNRTITGLNQISSGLCAIDDTTIINLSGSPTNGLTVFEVSITGGTAFSVPKFQIQTNRLVSGDFILTTTNKFIVTTRLSISPFTTYLEQYSWPDGTLELDLDISADIDFPYGIYQYLDGIFIVNGSDGVIYEVDKASPHTITASASTSLDIGIINGASQLPSALTVHFSGDSVPPSAPGSNSASNICQTTFTLSWGAATDNIGVTNYRVEQSTNNIVWSTYSTVGNVLSVGITGQTASTLKYWRVKAIDAAGNVGNNNSVISVTQSPSVTGIFVGETSFISSFAACSNGPGDFPNTLYVDNTSVNNGDTIYEDSCASIIFNGGANWWWVDDAGAGFAVIISAGGVVSSKTSC